MKIEELGKRLKLKQSEYASLSDKEAGVALVHKYPQYASQVDAQELALYKFGSGNTEVMPESLVAGMPKVIAEIERNLSVARGSFAILFPARRAAFIEKQLEHKIAQYKRAHQLVVEEFEHYQLPRRLAEKEIVARLLHASLVQSHQLALEGQRLVHEVSAAQSINAITVANAASEELVDVPTYTAEHLEREKTRLRIEEKEKTEGIAFHYAQKTIEAEVDGELRLHNTDELIRAQKVASLIDYGKRLEAARSQLEKEIYEKEIARLKGLLYGEPSTAASQEASGEDPEGGNTPSNSGDKSSASPRKARKQPPAPDLGTIQ